MNFRFYTFFLLMFFSASTAMAANRYSVATGNWSSTSTWSATSGGSSGASAPVAGDVVYIEGNRTVTINVNAYCASISIDNGSSLNIGAYTTNFTGTTTVSGTLTVTSTTGSKTFNQLVISGGTFRSNVAETYTITSLTLEDGTLTGSNTGVFNVGAGGLLFTEGTTNNVNRSTLTISGVTTVDGDVEFTSATGNKTFIGRVNINGVWNNSINEAVVFRGGITNNGTFVSGTGTYTFNSSSQSIDGTSPLQFSNGVTITGAITITNNTEVTIIGNLGGSVAGSTWLNAAGSTLIASNAVMATGTLNASATGNTVNYNRSGTQTVKPTAYQNLTLSGTSTKTTTSITVNGILTIEGTATLTAAPTYGSDATIRYNTTASRTASVEWVTPFNGTGGLIIASTGTISLNAAKVISGPLTIEDGAALSVSGSNYALTVGGHFINNGTFTEESGTVTLNGSSQQNLGGTAATVFNNFTLNNSSGLVLNGTSNPTINGTLSLVSGKITTGSNTLILGSSSAVSGADALCYINGSLQKVIGASTASKTFEIGDANNYTPVALTFTGATNNGGTLTATTTQSDHPEIASSDINEELSVNRYWTLTNAGVTGFTSCSAVFTFVAGDLDAGADYSYFIVGNYAPSGWMYPTTGSTNPTSVQATGLTTFGDFQVGQCYPPSQPSMIAGNPTPCENSADQNYTVTNVSGVTYNWTVPAGWAITAGQNSNSILVTAGANAGNITVTPSTSCGAGTVRTLSVTPVNLPAQPDAISGNTTPCENSSNTYSVSNTTDTDYTWSLPAGWVQTGGGTTNSITVIAGSGSGNIEVTPSNACGPGTPQTLSVSALSLPMVTAVSGSEEICDGSPVELSVSALPASAPADILTEDFNDETNGWTTINNTSGSVPENAAWTLRSDGYVVSSTTFHSNDNSQFYMTNSDAPGSGTTTATILQSPSVNTTGYTALTLSFWHHYRYYDGNESGKVEVSTNGTDWTTEASYTSNQGTATGFTNAIIDLDSYIGNSVLYIRFKYDATYDWWWAIDNVSLTGTPVSYVYQYSWQGSPAGTAGLPAGASTPSEGNSTITVNPSQTTTYTATALSSTGCSATDVTSITVNPVLAVSVSIVASENPICAGTNVTFTATPVNGGLNPVYQWKLNGSNAGTNNSVYSNASLANGDEVYCTLTSEVTCASGSPASSNMITMVVNPVLPASVSIAASENPTCAGSPVTFTATPVNGGSSPSYQWKLNGANVGTNSPVYTTSALTSGNTVSCVMTSGVSCASGSPATSNTITMTVNPVVAAGLSIAASENPVCAGTNVTFTATPVNGGSTPAYQWKLNGVNVGTNSPTYSNASLANGNTVTCEMTSNAPCVTGSPATSNTITMTVNPVVAASVSIAASENPICAGTSVTFTATPVNGGSSPAYQWKLNGVNVGTNSPTYSNSSLTNGNTVYCVMTSDATCVTGSPASSNTVTMTVNPLLAAGVSIASSENPICSGTEVTFTATPVNGGAAPSYQWKLNGVNVGSDSPVYTNSSLSSGNTITCVMTSNATCVTGSPATSNTITMTVNPVLPVSVTIVASDNPVCSGTSVTFTATPVNGGSSPTYQWKLNGVNVGSNNPVYTNSSLVNDNTISCVLTSDATCATGNPANSNTITMEVGSVIGNNSLDLSTGVHGSVCATAVENANATVSAPSGKVFVHVLFASYGTPNGTCGTFTQSACHAATSFTVTENYLLGNNPAVIPATNGVFGDPCAGTFKRLYVEAIYGEPVCAGSSPGQINGSVPTGGNGIFAYLWESSTTGATSGFTDAPGTNDGQNYTPGNLTQTTWFRRTVTSGGCSGTSRVIMITVTPVITGNTIGSVQTICEGSAPSALTGSSPGGGNGSYSYLWESSTTNAGSGFSPASGTNTAIGYTPPTLSSTTWFRRSVISGGCTDISSTVQITVTPLPAATISYDGSPYCSTSGIISVTRTGTAGGTYSALPAGLSLNAADGSVNTGTSTPGSYTVTYTIAASGGCGDVTTTAPIAINADGLWTGTTSTDWNTAGNWACNTVPAITTNVVIPGSLSNYPILSSGAAGMANNLTIQNNATLTVTGNTLQIAGNVSNSGTFTSSAGTIELKGNSLQTITAGQFDGNTVANLIINNTNGVILGGNLNITGILTPQAGTFNTDGYLTLVSTAAQTALISGSASGSVTGSVTMQRYLPSGFGYRYLSSPFQAATVSGFSDDINLAALFPSMFKYDEDKESSGWTAYTEGAGLLDPMAGYCLNFGTSSDPVTADLTGTVNNNTMGPIALYNHDRTYTLGFNLIGNPYPSPIDWNAATGWTRTNIDNALYYFKAGTTDEYGGTYCTYINGVSSDGTAGNVIPSMQGFFVHVSDGTFPVNGLFGMDNRVRVNNLTPAFHKSSNDKNYPMVRISAGYDGDNLTEDPVVVYFTDEATEGFDKELDALKLFNTDKDVPNLYILTGSTQKLSISAQPEPGNITTRIPLGIKTEKEDWLIFRCKAIENLPMDLHAYLFDEQTGDISDLKSSPEYRVKSGEGTNENRFALIFSPTNYIDEQLNADFIAFVSNGLLIVDDGVSPEKHRKLTISNLLGQVLIRTEMPETGHIEIHPAFPSGIYILTLTSQKEVRSQKIYLSN
ncbi:MAG: T9SS type A sorting domain-containing protein [Bacteroidota bacterium]